MVPTGCFYFSERSSGAERSSYKRDVGGSNPPVPIERFFDSSNKRNVGGSSPPVPMMREEKR